MCLVTNISYYKISIRVLTRNFLLKSLNLDVDDIICRNYKLQNIIMQNRNLKVYFVNRQNFKAFLIIFFLSYLVMKTNY